MNYEAVNKAVDSTVFMSSTKSAVEGGTTPTLFSTPLQPILLEGGTTPQTTEGATNFLKATNEYPPPHFFYPPPGDFAGGGTVIGQKK